MSNKPLHVAKTDKADGAFSLKRAVRCLPFVSKLERSLNNQFARDEFVIKQLAGLSVGLLLLDAGCGSQRYRCYCNHLEYRAQDFGKFKTDSKKVFGYEDDEDTADYQYGTLDYVGDVWDIEENPGRLMRFCAPKFLSTFRFQTRRSRNSAVYLNLAVN
jgi:hypothetical protein